MSETTYVTTDKNETRADVDYEQVRDAVQELFETAYRDFPYEADGTETE